MAVPELTSWALGRFGLGPRPGDLARIGSDLRGALMEELRRGATVLPGSEDIVDSATALGEMRDENERQKAARVASPVAGPQIGPDVTGPPAPAPKPPVPVAQRLFLAEAKARITAATTAEIGFVERLVWFWSNHFAASAIKGGPNRALAGAYEREAIRPHVLGRFADLLWAVETHPAMLFYLDNQGSVGPNSPAGQRRGRGLNENLGREILELHTLGAGGGYSQADVTTLAAILTGWTVAGAEGRIGRPGTAAFNANAHEPGPQMLLGRVYADEGPDQLRAALPELARHPSTGRHVALKLARHFVADDPPPSLVARLERSFKVSDGDLFVVSSALLEAPEAWSPEQRKMRSPAEFLAASARLLQTPVTDPRPWLGGLGLMGQPLWSPQEPNGFPDTLDHWASPEGLKVRLDVAARMAQRATALSPADLVDAAFGDGAAPETRDAVLRAESRPQAIALLLMSPQFQRR